MYAFVIPMESGASACESDTNQYLWTAELTTSDVAIATTERWVISIWAHAITPLAGA
jgi:hypothetical protein